MSVSILYYKVSQERINSSQLSAQIALWMEEIPLNKQNSIKKLHKQNDQLLSLIGLQLLKIAMPEFCETAFSLNQVQFHMHEKPFWGEKIDFNISHSGDIVCCVISDTSKVGIDIELQRKVKPATINKFLNESNNSHQDNTDKNNSLTFFKIWTKNEAIIKAANHGSIFNMSEIKHEEHGGYYQDKFWFSYPIEIVSNDNKEYTCHVACSNKIASQEIKIKQIYEL